MPKIKLIFQQIIRAGLRILPGVGEIIEAGFQYKDAIAYHEMQKLVEELKRDHGERLSRLEQQGPQQAEEVIAQIAPRLVEAHREQFAEVGHKLGLLDTSHPKIIEFAEHFEQGETTEFLEESGLEQQFPHLSKDILRHISREGRIRDIYELGEKIGEGGMSRIVTARRKGESEVIALKILRPEVGKIERFLIEGYVGKYHLNSPYLLQTRDFGGFLNSGEYFIECELLEGQSTIVVEGRATTGRTGGITQDFPQRLG
jgi:hypothetical protein